MNLRIQPAPVRKSICVGAPADRAVWSSGLVAVGVGLSLELAEGGGRGLVGSCT